MKKAQCKIASILIFEKGVNEDLADQFKAVIYRISSDLDEEQLRSLAKNLTNHALQGYELNTLDEKLDFLDEFKVIETGYLPGITNNLASCVIDIIQDAYEDVNIDGCKTASILIYKNLLAEEVISNLYNPLIEYCSIQSFANWRKNLLDFSKDDSMPVAISRYCGEKEIILPDDDLLLKKLSKDNLLSLNIEQMRVIKKYFTELKRNPRQIELEMLAQSWSEHCKHNIFSASIDDIKDGLYKHYIKSSTEEISLKKDLCISVFADNAGAIIFDDEYAIAVKVETHNSPSALEPYGGSMTGVLGVNRDVIGFGLGALPISNHYAFCFSDQKYEYYRDSKLTQPILSNKNIVDGVTKGVEVGGNHSGVPTTNGLVYYGSGFVAKPLVFVGTVGLIPRKHCFGLVQDGDLIVIVGGKTGRDGIHGATFSSESLHNVSSSVVQIGDPITQKKFSDAIIKEARDLGLYNAITDNGAGGFSSSIGEMGQDGFIVDLEKAPLKCSYMEPWEIWISESQERMTLAVPREKYLLLEQVMQKHVVEIAVIGTFNNSGKAIIKFHDKIILELDTSFIHKGSPKMKLESKVIDIAAYEHIEEKINSDSDLLDVLLHKNISNRRKFALRYDHEVQGKTILKPLQGKGRVFADTTIIKPLLKSIKGVVQSQSLGIFYENLSEDGKNFYPANHPYYYAKRAIETAIRNLVITGSDLDKISLLDNFCWSNFGNDEPYNKKRLWQLKMASKACYDMAIFFKAPFISGKDSMFNNANLYNKDGSLECVSNFPTLLITAIGIIDNIRNCVSLEVKFPGDLIYCAGDITDDEINPNKIMELYKSYNNAINEGIIASGIAINFGGIAVALAKKIIGGLLGAEIDFANYANLRYKRFSGMIFTVAPSNKAKCEIIFAKVPHFKLGTVTDDNCLKIKNIGNYKVSGKNSLQNSYDA